MREGEKGQRERMRDALWFCSALRSPGLPVQERMEGRGGRDRSPENQKWKEGKEAYKGGRGSVMSKMKSAE